MRDRKRKETIAGAILAFLILAAVACMLFGVLACESPVAHDARPNVTPDDHEYWLRIELFQRPDSTYDPPTPGWIVLVNKSVDYSTGSGNDLWIDGVQVGWRPWRADGSKGDISWIGTYGFDPRTQLLASGPGLIWIKDGWGVPWRAMILPDAECQRVEIVARKGDYKVEVGWDPIPAIYLGCEPGESWP